ADRTPDPCPWRGRQGDVSGFIWKAEIVRRGGLLCRVLASVSAECDGVLPDPDDVQEGVQGLVGLLVRLGEPCR
ncbi:hypothetical protein, partial [Streptomyces xanthophaeus]|uniref:hypothetical protein n=1 Tax=Streptomyces xanthophaeus TaxID=67385 RepID=UPI003649BA89